MSYVKFDFNKKNVREIQEKFIRNFAHLFKKLTCFFSVPNTIIIHFESSQRPPYYPHLPIWTKSKRFFLLNVVNDFLFFFVPGLGHWNFQYLFNLIHF